VFEMSVLRKICGITGKDRRRNVDILKQLSIGKDIVDLLQVRRLTYFGRVNRIWAMTDFQSYYYMATHMDIGREEEQKRNGQTISVRTVRT